MYFYGIFLWLLKTITFKEFIWFSRILNSKTTIPTLLTLLCYIFECKIFNNTFDVWLRQGLNIYSVSWLVQGNSTFPLNCNVPLAVSIFAEVKFMHRYEIFTIFFFFFDISNKNWDFTFCILRSYAMIEWWNLIINKRMNRRGLNLEYKK